MLNLKINLFCSYKNIYRELEQNIKTADAVEDLRWFRANQGPGMSMNWPQFEVRSEYGKPTLVFVFFFSSFLFDMFLSGETLRLKQLLAVNFVILIVFLYFYWVPSASTFGGDYIKHLLKE